MSKCWYCNNELATGDNPKHFGICNKCYDEMFKSSDTIIRSFTNKLADLEAKLADLQSEQIKEMQEHQEAMKLADKTIKDLEIKLLLKPSFGKFKSADELYKSYTNLEKEYTKLRQQLAEKDNKIQMLNAMIATLPEHDKELKEICNQDKISFAVEQLTEVRDYVKECNSLDMVEGKIRLDIAKKIRLKIEQLKKEMK